MQKTIPIFLILCFLLHGTASQTAGQSLGHLVAWQENPFARRDQAPPFYTFLPFMVKPTNPVVPLCDLNISDEHNPSSCYFWPADVQTVSFTSASYPAYSQPARFYEPPAQNQAEPIPLLVGLHTWSTNFDHFFSSPYAYWAISNHWAFINPDFRGSSASPNPDAMGSDMVVQAVVDAVTFAQANANIDPKRIYLIGSSGGGHVALLLAARRPDIWAGVSAWSGISNLKDWYYESLNLNPKFAQHIDENCGPALFTTGLEDECALTRSPISWLGPLSRALPLDINAGINDGHVINNTTYAVPISHSLYAFNAVIDPQMQITQNQINRMTQQMEIPSALQYPGVDPLYGAKQPLFRRDTGTTRITIFNGDHEIIYWAGLSWLFYQRKP